MREKRERTRNCARRGAQRVMRVSGALLVVLLVAPLPARAQDRTTVGVISMLAGGGLIAAAFDYRGDQCPQGYTTHRFEGLTTQCVSIFSDGSSSVLDATTAIRYKRPGLMWSGVAAAGLGTVLLLLPDRAANATPSVDFAPDGWRVSKMFSWK